KSVDRDISDTYFNKMCQRIKAMNYSGNYLLFKKREVFIKKPSCGNGKKIVHLNQLINDEVENNA
ncbi:hypothetical protein R6K75_09030, partial [Enterococcus faecium]|uniref:hypothetical protein n=1 Tax=Enterococcus faecium TaxID=1352 RepID=UPI00296A9A43